MASDERLGYLLKHAHKRLIEFTGPAMAPYGIDGRELAVLTVLAGGEALSQQQAAQRLGIDRTTMVALLDVLEAKGLVGRRTHPEDRRKNVVELTPSGQETLRDATAASNAAEGEFLTRLGTADARRLKDMLGLLLSEDR
jgi:DNA-binding MarR family transcriptional regulator